MIVVLIMRILRLLREIFFVMMFFNLSMVVFRIVGIVRRNENVVVDDLFWLYRSFVLIVNLLWESLGRIVKV